MRRGLRVGVLLVAAACAAAELAAGDEEARNAPTPAAPEQPACAEKAAADGAAADSVDRYGVLKTSKVPNYVVSAVLVSVFTGFQLVTPGWVETRLGGAAAAGAGRVAVRGASTLMSLRKKHPLGMVLTHGVVSKACADVLAQTIPQQNDPQVWIDPLRVFRSMLASVLTTSLPFYYWTKLMAHVFRGYDAAVGALKLPAAAISALSSGFAQSLSKTVVTQAIFRPFNVAGFLALQSIFRGDSARTLVGFLRNKVRACHRWPLAHAPWRVGHASS